METQYFHSAKTDCCNFFSLPCTTQRLHVTTSSKAGRQLSFDTFVGTVEILFNKARQRCCLIQFYKKRHSCQFKPKNFPIAFFTCSCAPCFQKGSATHDQLTKFSWEGSFFSSVPFFKHRNMVCLVITDWLIFPNTQPFSHFVQTEWAKPTLYKFVWRTCVAFPNLQYCLRHICELYCNSKIWPNT